MKYEIIAKDQSRVKPKVIAKTVWKEVLEKIKPT